MARALKVSSISILFLLVSFALFSQIPRGSTGGSAVTSVIYNTPILASNASFGPTTMDAPVANQMIRFSFYLTQSDIGTSCSTGSTLTFTGNYTDGDNSTAYSLLWTNGLIQGGGNAVTAYTFSTVNVQGANGNIRTTPFYYYIKGGTTFTITGTYALGTGCAPGPKYNFRPFVEAF